MITRRAFERGLVAAASLPPILALAAEGGESVSVRIRADDAVIDKTIPLIARQGLTVIPDTTEAGRQLAARIPQGRGGPAIVIIAGAIAAGLIAETIAELLRQREYGGVVIDLRQKPPLITHDPAMPGNMAFVITPEGKTERHDSSAISADWVRGLLKP